MTVWEAFICILLFGGMIYFLGHSFIDAVFVRKGEIINRMIEKGDV
jgi:hypothetical protein